MGNTSRSKPGKARSRATCLPVKVKACLKKKGLHERFFEYKFIADQPSRNENDSHAPIEEREDTHPLTNATTNNEQDSSKIYGVLNALVLANSICVLTSPYETDYSKQSNSSTISSSSTTDIIPSIQSILFSESSDGTMDLSTEDISGKRKKGAKKINAGHTICTFIYNNGLRRRMVSPVGGMVLELNTEHLSISPELMQSDPIGRGHIAVILPEDDLVPSLENTCNIPQATSTSNSSSTDNNNSNDDTNIGVTFSIVKGQIRAEKRAKDIAAYKNAIAKNSTVNNTDSHINDEDPASMNIVVNGPGTKAMKAPCYAFSNGACLRGDRCRWAHIESDPPSSTSSNNEKRQKKEDL
jgi:hypothetical protein